MKRQEIRNFLAQCTSPASPHICKSIYFGMAYLAVATGWCAETKGLTIVICRKLSKILPHNSLTIGNVIFDYKTAI